MNLPDWLYEKPTLPAEETFDRFVTSFEGQKIADLLCGNPHFKMLIIFSLVRMLLQS